MPSGLTPGIYDDRIFVLLIQAEFKTKKIKSIKILQFIIPIDPTIRFLIRINKPLLHIKNKQNKKLVTGTYDQ